MLARRVVFSFGLVIAFAGMAGAQAQLAVDGVAPPATLSIPAGSAVSIAVSGGPANPTDWVGLYATGASDGSYLDWQYLSGSTAPPANGVTDTTITFTMLAIPGEYEFRLFANNGYLRLATSATITIASMAQLTVNGISPPTVVSAYPGTNLTVTASSGPANTTDWVGLFAAGAPNSAYLDWRYLNGTMTPPASGVATGTMMFSVPVAPGNYEFRLFARNGFTLLATSTAVTVGASPAQLSVNGVPPPATASVNIGTRVTVNVSSGPSNAGDWIGLFAVDAPDNAYLRWQYLNGSTSQPETGASAATLTFDVPAVTGSYEFRLFANNGFLRLATSTVVVTPSLAQLTVNGVAAPESVTVVAGSGATVAVSDGPANAADWVGLYTVGGADGAYLAWQYLSGAVVAPTGGVSMATLHFTLPTAGGPYEFRLFADNGFGRLATSSPVSVIQTATITVNGTSSSTAVSAAAGSVATVGVSGGPGNRADWVGLFTVGAANGAYLEWKYLG